MTLHDWMKTISDIYEDRTAAREELDELVPKCGHLLDMTGTEKEVDEQAWQFIFDEPQLPIIQDDPTGMSVVDDG